MLSLSVKYMVRVCVCALSLFPLPSQNIVCVCAVSLNIVCVLSLKVRVPTHWRIASVVVKVEDLLPRRSAAIIGAATTGGSAGRQRERGRVRLRRPCHEEHEEKHTENCKRNEDVTDSLPARNSWQRQ